MNDEPILEVENLSKNFGGVRAVENISFRIAPGDIIGIIGPNGSGKTTLINLISGFLKPTRGRVMFRGRKITRLEPHVIADMGITRTFQIMRPFHSLSALKNLIIPLYSPRAKRIGGWRGGGRHGNRDTVSIDILEELGFERDSRVPYQFAGTLPIGYLKRLELGRCIALRPEVILCDEIFSGLSTSETASLVPLIEKLHNQGITLVLIEHRLRELFKLVDRVLVLSQGKKIAEGESGIVMADPDVREAYFGAEEDKP
jgi:branched-chain amino acid transport system ATP-binding protein